jgi:hypothetical protein
LGVIAVSKTFEDFLAALAQKESSGRYGIENYSGYLGKYQMGEHALIDAGYYLRDGTDARRNADGKYVDNDWIGHWTGRKGVKSKGEFLSDPDAQEDAIRRHVANLWKQIRALRLDSYEGATINGIVITKSGMICGAHLKGVGGLKTYLKSAGRNIPTDGNNTSIEFYVSTFGGYDIEGFLKDAGDATGNAVNHRAVTTDGQYRPKSIPAKQSLRNGANSQHYGVRPGDTLSRISRMYNLSVGEILAVNPSITDKNRIVVGQKLVIPSDKTARSSYHKTPHAPAPLSQVGSTPRQPWWGETFIGSFRKRWN